MSIAENLAQLRDMAVRVEAIEAAAKAMAADVGLDLDNLAASADPSDTADQLDAWRKNWIEEARIAYEAIAPLVRQAARADVAQEIEASIVDDEARYGSCTCADGKECHPHACHRLLNTVTADEDTWPVHIKVGAWKALDPEIRRDAAAIARGDIAAADETTGDGHG